MEWESLKQCKGCKYSNDPSTGFLPAECELRCNGSSFSPNLILQVLWRSLSHCTWYKKHKRLRSDMRSKLSDTLSAQTLKAWVQIPKRHGYMFKHARYMLAHPKSGKVLTSSQKNGGLTFPIWTLFQKCKAQKRGPQMTFWRATRSQTLKTQNSAFEYVLNGHAHNFHESWMNNSYKDLKASVRKASKIMSLQATTTKRDFFKHDVYFFKNRSLLEEGTWTCLLQVCSTMRDCW